MGTSNYGCDRTKKTQSQSTQKSKEQHESLNENAKKTIPIRWLLTQPDKKHLVSIIHKAFPRSTYDKVYSYNLRTSGYRYKLYKVNAEGIAGRLVMLRRILREQFRPHSCEVTYDVSTAGIRALSVVVKPG